MAATVRTVDPKKKVLSALARRGKKRTEEEGKEGSGNGEHQCRHKWSDRADDNRGSQRPESRKADRCQEEALAEEKRTKEKKAGTACATTIVAGSIKYVRGQRTRRKKKTGQHNESHWARLGTKQT